MIFVIGYFCEVLTKATLHSFEISLFQNLTKEQADYCISRMKPYVDRSGRAIPDAYDYADFTGSMFVN